MANSYFFITQVIEAIFSELDNDGSPHLNEEVEEPTIERSESSMESMEAKVQTEPDTEVMVCRR